MHDDPIADRDDSIDADLDPGRRIIIVPETNRNYLDNKQVMDYYEYRKRFLEWLLHFGKNPTKAEGYSPHTVYSTGYRAARFDLWRWERDEEYSVPPRHDDADEFMKKIAYGDLKKVTKGKMEEMVKRYFKWLGQFRRGAARPSRVGTIPSVYFSELRERVFAVRRMNSLMSTTSLSPADKAAQTAGVIRQLLGAWLLVGLLWFVIFIAVELPSFVEFLLLSSVVPLGGLSVFLWRAFIAYRDTVQ